MAPIWQNSSSQVAPGTVASSNFLVLRLGRQWQDHMLWTTRAMQEGPCSRCSSFTTTWVRKMSLLWAAMQAMYIQIFWCCYTSSWFFFWISECFLHIYIYNCFCIICACSCLGWNFMGHQDHDSPSKQRKHIPILACFVQRMSRATDSADLKSQINCRTSAAIDMLRRPMGKVADHCCSVCEDGFALPNGAGNEAYHWWQHVAWSFGRYIDCWRQVSVSDGVTWLMFISSACQVDSHSHESFNKNVLDLLNRDWGVRTWAI